MSDKLRKGKGELPLYYQLEIILKDRIMGGEFSNGDIFPCERELMAYYGVSRITVRQALANLNNAGLIEAHPGIGTVVVFDKINEQLTKVKSFSEEMREHGMEMNTSESECTYAVPPVEIASALGLSMGEQCFCLARVRCADSTPVVYSLTYVSSKWGLEAEPALYDESLYAYMENKKGIAITGAKDTFEAVASDVEIAKRIQIRLGSPVLKRTRISYVNDKEIFEFTVCWYRADKYKYTVEL
ncbi:MAG: GntR family transcriptional regulator [Spirochaetales bacterium]|nr:GntR family transcriptional regulator [Spirochaetales bacterium]